MNTYVTSAGTPVTDLQAAAPVMYAVPILLSFVIARRGVVTAMSTAGLT